MAFLSNSEENVFFQTAVLSEVSSKPSEKLIARDFEEGLAGVGAP